MQKNAVFLQLYYQDVSLDTSRLDLWIAVFFFCCCLSYGRGMCEGGIKDLVHMRLGIIPGFTMKEI